MGRSMINVLERPALTVVGMAIQTQPRSAEIPALWPKFVARMAEIQDLGEPQVSYGVMQYHAGAPAPLFYMAGVSVSSDDRVPSGMESLVLAAGTYAVFRYPLSGLGKGFGEIFNRLLPSSDYQQAAGPYFERYDEAFDPGNAASLVEIYLPVRERTSGR
jgi:AraC family transcriptional regulator